METIAKDRKILMRIHRIHNHLHAEEATYLLRPPRNDDDGSSDLYIPNPLKCCLLEHFQKKGSNSELPRADRLRSCRTYANMKSVWDTMNENLQRRYETNHRNGYDVIQCYTLFACFHIKFIWCRHLSLLLFSKTALFRDKTEFIHDFILYPMRHTFTWAILSLGKIAKLKYREPKTYIYKRKLKSLEYIFWSSITSELLLSVFSLTSFLYFFVIFRKWNWWRSRLMGNYLKIWLKILHLIRSKVKYVVSMPYIYDTKKEETVLLTNNLKEIRKQLSNTISWPNGPWLLLEGETQDG